MSLDQHPHETVGERIKRLRTKRQLSQQDLSQGMIGIEMLQLIEMNLARPSKTVKKELAARLGVTVDIFQTTENKLPKRRVWEHVRMEVIEGKRAVLSRHVYLRRQWRFSGNVVVADDDDEAIQTLTKHAKKCEGHYWDRYGSSRFTVQVFGVSGSLFKHRVEPDVWLWNDFVCHAESFDDWLVVVKHDYFKTLLTE